MDLKKIAHSNWFSNLIAIVIVINAVLIGVQTGIDNEFINRVQHVALGIFILEIFIRWFGKHSTKEYVNNYWNWFDIAIVLIALIPPDVFADGAAVSALRVARVFRVVRMFKAFPELQLLIRVLLRSFRSVYFACLLLLVFMYMYAVIGVTLFKGITTVVTAHSSNVDPFGNILEAFFSLFRVTTAEDWTDLRYDLIRDSSDNPEISSSHNFVKDSSYYLVNVYFISWYVMSAFLLVNIVFGAIINNYEVVYNEEKDKTNRQKDDSLLDKVDRLEAKIDTLMAKQSGDNS